MAPRAKWSPKVVQTVGRAAWELATKYRAELEPRLAAGVLDGFTADLEAFEHKRDDASNALGTLMAATRTQSAVAAEAVELLTTAREALRRGRTPAKYTLEFGLKSRPNPTVVSSVRSALSAFTTAAARYPEVVRAVGILPSDLETMVELRNALIDVDAKQEAAKATRKTPVAERTALQVRIESAVDAIISAGRLAFVKRPDVADAFKALVPGKSTAKKPAPTK